ncbi:glycine betaine/L-proline ABC transporter substrate-binding protein ProX [Pararhizobium sp. DWP1-1-3]|uniref:glycine betaine/L-proline ABC transporter substrate-binding protein ProX n=1 Tax=Pararhizobium sp. DWP1-1-3 TaxID=2804652 RepID=UPI003CEE61EF
MRRFNHFTVLAAGFAAVGYGAMANDLPGEGKTVRFARGDSLGANYIQDEILIAGLKKLGYDVKLSTVSTNVFFQAAAQGDLDVAADINIPQEVAAYTPVKDRVDLIGDGNIVGGGTNGYLVDKKTADEYHLTSIDQLKDPKIAALFDTNSDGKADLVNCDPGWQCGDVVDYQVEKFGLSDTVKTVRGKYEVLLAETFARFKRGEPTLVYTWQPSWVTDTLKPGTTTVWLPIPFDALPPGIEAKNGHLVKGVVGCAGGQDPCRMVTGSWNWMAAGNKKFLQENPSVRAFLAKTVWPTTTWAEWESTLNDNSTDRAIKKTAEKWIAENQTVFDNWVAEASTATN